MNNIIAVLFATLSFIVVGNPVFENLQNTTQSRIAFPSVHERHISHVNSVMEQEATDSPNDQRQKLNELKERQEKLLALKDEIINNSFTNEDELYEEFRLDDGADIVNARKLDGSFDYEKFGFVVQLYDIVSRKFCTGAAIGRTVFITAAHCVVDDPSDPSRFTMRKNGLTIMGGDEVNVIDIKMHPKYPVMLQELANAEKNKNVYYKALF
ncbi:hypothetical protein M3Y95_01227300 [Aphelenchoides besseyi]|nr:hypothetical protein M3Y95_01227300 [Aphelenchoides besseyi]